MDGRVEGAHPPAKHPIEETSMRLARRSFALALAGLPLARLNPSGAQAAPSILLDNVRYFDGRAMTGPARLLMIDGIIRVLGSGVAPDGAQRVDLDRKSVV